MFDLEQMNLTNPSKETPAIIAKRTKPTKAGSKCYKEYLNSLPLLRK